MKWVVEIKRIYTSSLSLLLVFMMLCTLKVSGEESNASSKKFIKWVDFTVTEAALADAMRVDIETHGTANPVSWIEILAILAAKSGGNFENYKKADLEQVADALKSGEKPLALTKNEKLYMHYKTAYSAILDGMLGEYTEITDGIQSQGYGLIAYSPIAKGYYYNHYDDFGASRSYGYRRKHLGHDLMGSVGTPVIAVEGGYVEACGWNQYGGWRIGIRSFDGKRYYYYAHLRKNHPYADVYEGKIIDAGEVIGYLGMTGYSSKENTNNINVPHLHYGLQLIFDPSQKDGWNQIWVDMYALTNFLAKNKSEVAKDEDGEWHAKSVRIPSNSWD